MFVNDAEIAHDLFQLENIPLKPNALKQYEGMERIWFSFKKEVRIIRDNIWIPRDFHSSRQFISDKETEVEEKPRKQITPHAKFIAHQIQHGKVMLNSWQYLKKLAAESRGTEIIELQGYGPIYLKLHLKDISGTVLYSQTAFASPTDGKTVKKTAFDRAWNRIRGHF